MSEIGERIAKLSPEQRALLQKRLAGEAPAAASAPAAAHLEPIAIVGAACRLPGGVNDLDAFWRMLCDGIDGVVPVPPQRWDADRLFDKDPAAAGKIASRWGGFISGADEFDADYFGISPREAEEMDPQQRIVLETAIDALDNAGIPRDALAGTAMGVFVGLHGHASDYLLLQNENVDELDTFSGTGAAHNMLAGRLSYVLNTHGPAIVIDTACSSSLVALHLAVQSLRAGESTSALVAGVNLILTPNFTIAASRMRMLAPDGRCKAFDHRADGFVRSEGCGVVLLRRLSDAVADGDTILAIVRGSAINQDGHTNGITAPNGIAQRQVIEKALANAGVPAPSIGFIEAHGTGTSLGDPIEIEALAATVGQRAVGAPHCFVGSVKTNIGHLEGAAGIAGLIKAALVLRHGVVTPNLHFTKLNPLINTAGTRLRFPIEVTPLPGGDGPRRAAVSSFGWSGTNAHVILEEAPRAEATGEVSAPEQSVRVLPISGMNAEAAVAMARRLSDRLRSQPPASIDDVCFTAAVRRTHYGARLVAIGHSTDDLAQAIDDAIERGPTLRGASDKQRIAFVFPGHGAQWAGMGQTLLRREPVFRDAIARCDAAIKAEAGWSLIEQIATPRDTTRFDEAAISQPAVFAFGVALAELWASWGVVPDAVVGHSMGEVAAAHVAGSLSLADATRIICRRSQLLQQVVAQGGMLLADLTEQEARREIAAFGGRLSIGAVNGPRSVVLAGDHAAIDAIAAALTSREVFCRLVKGSPPGHSYLVAGFGPALLADVAGIAPRAGAVPFYSTVTAGRLAGERLDPEYWVRNLCEPVRFLDAVRSLLENGVDTLIEIGPHPILSPAITDIAAERPAQGDADESGIMVLPSMRRDEDDHAVLYGSVGKLYERGASIRWSAVAPRTGRAVALPPYAWQRKSYWLTRTPSRREATMPVAASAGARADMLYKAAWTEAPTDLGSARPVGRFIIVAGRTGASATFAAALDAALTAAGGYALVISDDDPVMALDRASGATAAWSGIVHCSALDATPTDSVTDATLSADPVPGRESFLAIVRSLDTGAWKGEPRLAVVTRGATVVSGDDRARLAIAQAPLSGLARIAHAEHPRLFSAWIDIDPGATLARQAADVMAALSSDDGEPSVAFRGGHRFLQRLAPLSDAPTTSRVKFRPDASYILTGGLGGVGLHAARWMIAQGARHLLILGRTPLPPRASWRGIDREADASTASNVAAVLELEARGASVHYAAVDAGDAVALSALLSQWGEDARPPIGGIAHCAAVFEFGLLTELGRESIGRVFGAKARAAWLLHSLVPEAEWLLLFSSMAVCLPTAGLGDYVASNAFLDALAEYRNGSGRHGASVGWGVWKEVVVSAADRVRDGARHLERKGIRSFAAADGVAALDTLLERSAPHALVLNLERAELAKDGAGSTWPILRGLIGAQQPAAASAGAQRDGFAGQLLGADAETVVELLRRCIAQHVQTVLKLGDVRVDVNRTLGEYGLNSLVALELRTLIERDLALRLPATLAFNYPTVAGMAEHLASRLRQSIDRSPPTETKSSERSPTPAGPGGFADVATLEALSDASALEALRAGKPGGNR